MRKNERGFETQFKGLELELNNLQYTIRAWWSSKDEKKAKHAYHTLFELCISNRPLEIVCCHHQQGHNEPLNSTVKLDVSFGVQYRATAAYKMSVCPHR